MGRLSQRTFTTDLEIKNLKGEDKIYWVKDSAANGLFLQVTPLGGKTWQYRYSVNGKQERIKLGKYPSVSLNQARSARAIYEEEYVAKGISKADVETTKQEKNAKQILFSDFSRQFAERKIISQIKNEKSMLSYLDKDILPFIGDKAVQDIKYIDISKVVLRKVNQGFPSAALQVYSLLKRIFDLASDLDIISQSPVKKSLLSDIKRPKLKQRALKPNEITAFYTALFQNNVARATKLGLLISLLVLIRKSELTNAQWKDINFDTGVWHIPQPKGFDNSNYSSEPFDVYMSSQVKAILLELKRLAGDSAYILPGRLPTKPISRTVFNMAINSVLRRMPPEFGHFTVHDLRRTAASELNGLGYNSDVVEKCLNHKMTGIRGIYNKSEYETQRIEMMQEWSNHIFKLVPIIKHFMELSDDMYNFDLKR